MSLLSFGTALHSEHDVSPDQFEPGVPAESQARRHVLDLLIGGSTLEASLDLTSGLSADLRLPYRTIDTRAHFQDAARHTMPDFQSIHHSTRTHHGLGDLGVGTRFLIAEQGDLALNGRLGLSLPTGGIAPNPFELGKQGKPHEHMFFGSGTVDPAIGLDGSFGSGQFRGIGWASVRSSWYDNAMGYRAGTAIAAGFGTLVGLGPVTVSLQPKLHHETSSNWGDEDGGSSERSTVNASAGLFWRLSPSWQLNALVEVPLYTRAVSAQLSIPAIVTVGVSTSTRVVDW